MELSFVSIAARFTCANEMALTIALVVFIMLTVILALTILLLCVSSSFRAFLFRENKKGKSEPDSSDADEAEAKDGNDSQNSKTGKPKVTGYGRVDGGLKYYETIPTIPLDIPLQTAARAYEPQTRRIPNTIGRGRTAPLGDAPDKVAATPAPTHNTFTPSTSAASRSAATSERRRAVTEQRRRNQVITTERKPDPKTED